MVRGPHRVGLRILVHWDTPYNVGGDMNYEIGEVYAQVITDISTIIHSSCVDAGWYTDLTTGLPLNRNVPEMLCLVHSEISEALEGYRKDLVDSHLPQHANLDVELADAVIRILDLSSYLGIDIGQVISDKFDYNQVRADHKLHNRQKDGGKKI